MPLIVSSLDYTWPKKEPISLEINQQKVSKWKWEGIKKKKKNEKIEQESKNCWKTSEGEHIYSWNTKEKRERMEQKKYLKKLWLRSFQNQWKTPNYR